MLAALLWFCAGLFVLVKGGDWFVDGAVGVARKFRLPDLLIGATVVSVGTTLPEVMISASSALAGHGEIAYGNAVGSIICNAALVAAITIAVRPGKADGAALRLPAAFFFAAAAFFAAVAYTAGWFSRWVGAALLALFAAYLAAQILPYDGIGIRFPGLPVPCNNGFPLIGDTDGGNLIPRIDDFRLL